MQILEWYGELLRLTDSPVVRLNRAVAIGHADGGTRGPGRAGDPGPGLLRYTAVAAYLHEQDGSLATTARLYAQAARHAPNLPERNHLTRQAARLHTASQLPDHL